MNLEFENILRGHSDRHHEKSASKGLGGIKNNFMHKNNDDKNVIPLNDPSSRANRVKLGVLANSNITAGTPLRKAVPKNEKEQKSFPGDDFNMFVKYTSKKNLEKQYPPIEYGYVTKLNNIFDNEVLFHEPSNGVIWERDEEDEAFEGKEISDDELEAILLEI